MRHIYIRIVYQIIRQNDKELMMVKREAIFPANRHSLYETHGYSAAIRSGDLVFVSGQVGSLADGTPEPDFGRQVQLAFDNLAATLKAAGCGFDDIIDVTTFHTDPENQFETIMTVRSRNFINAPFPNWTAIGVNWLAGFDFEIKVIARVPTG
jgi:enamine deaminase RidA (YjgF/YER057c/UK114 family)